jgi:hypothetical protein
VARTRWLWWWGRAFVKREEGMGFEPKRRNQAAAARFRVHRVER